MAAENYVESWQSRRRWRLRERRERLDEVERSGWGVGSRAERQESIT